MEVSEEPRIVAPTPLRAERRVSLSAPPRHGTADDGHTPDVVSPAAGSEPHDGLVRRRRMSRRASISHMAKSRTLSEYVHGDDADHDEDDERRRSMCAAVYHMLGCHREVPDVPRTVVVAAVAVSWFALLMAVAELVLEVLIVSEAIPKVSFRLCFSFMTALSALLAIHVLMDLYDDELDTTVQALRVSLLVEVALVLTDFEYIYFEQDNPDSDELFYRRAYRAPFIVLTVTNIVLIIVQLHELGLLHTVAFIHLCVRHRRQAEEDDEEGPVEVVERSSDGGEVAKAVADERAPSVEV